MIRLAQSKRLDREFVLHGKFYAFDSTTIDLCLSLFKWAFFRKNSYFVIRQKSHLNYEIVDGEDLLDTTNNVLLDQTIRLTGYQTKKKYPGTLRRIVYYAPELKRTFTFLTNNFVLKASDIALLYKQRFTYQLETVNSLLKLRLFVQISFACCIFFK